MKSKFPRSFLPVLHPHGITTAWVTCLLLIWGPYLGYSQPGALDADYHPIFGYYVNTIIVQPDGKALFGGGFRSVQGLEYRAVARINLDGTSDTNFLSSMGEGSEVRALLLQPDGKILAGGQFLKVGTNLLDSLVRLESTGVPDPTFRSGLDGFSVVRALASQSDGCLLVATDGSVSRLMPDGGNDPTFAPLMASQWVLVPDGMVSAQNTFRCLAPLADRRVLVGGSVQAIDGVAVGAGLVRLNGDGSWDQTFQSYTNSGVSAMVLQPDGRIVVGRDGGLARLHPNGSLDDSFANLTVGGEVNSLVLQTDGKILVAGYFQRVAGWLRRGVARVNPDGTLDRSFDPDDLGGFDLTSVALQPDQKVLVGGYFEKLGGTLAYAARLHNDSPSSPSRFEFLSLSNSVPESAGQIAIPICRYGGTNGTVSVVAATTHWGSALPGSDYVETTQTLVFPPGVTTNYLNVKIVNDALVEGPYGWETFQIDLSSPLGGATLGSERQTIAYILEDDVGIGFGNDIDVAQEADGVANIPVYRFGLTNSLISASYSCQGGTAKSPSDYTSQSGTVTFEPGVTNAVISIPLNDDLLVEGDETFTIRLGAPTGGASLSIGSMTVRITDDVSYVALASDRSVTEKEGQAILPIMRWGRTNNTVSVDYSTKNLTAQSGTDYAASMGAVTFLPGQTEQNITIPILDDDAIEDLEQFQVSINHPVGSLVIPYGDTRTITIISDDGPGYPDVLFNAAVPGNRVNQLELCPGDRILIRGDGSSTNGSWRPTLVRYLPDGSVDTSFQHNLADEILAMAVDAQSRIYVGTGVGLDSKVLRLAADGSEDRSFDPFFFDPIITGPTIYPAMAVQSDGKVLVGAVPQFQYGYEATTNALNRLNEDGSYDPMFQPDVHFGSDTLASAPYCIAIQPDGRILIGATLQNPNGQLHEAVVRLTAKGQFDESFDPIVEVDSRVQGIHFFTDGRILLNGSFTSISGRPCLGLAILRANGSLDANFAPAFQSVDYFVNSVAAAAIQADAKILICGGIRTQTGSELALARLNSDGSLDSSFHVAPTFSIYLWRVMLQGDGKILVGGTSGPFFGRALERLNNDPEAAGGSIEFTTSSILCSETNRTITLSVRRTGASHGIVHVAYSTANGSAQDGADFTAESGVLEFRDGEAGEKTVTVPILDDLLVETNECFSVNLAPPVGGAVWGEHPSTQVWIQDNEVAMAPRLAVSSKTNGEFHAEFEGSPGAVYSVWWSTNLFRWQEAGLLREGSPGRFEFSHPIPPDQPVRFYQVQWP